MSFESFPSPNAIPPRTSSYGIFTNGNSPLSPTRPVLRPLSEVDWIAQSKRSSAHTSAAPMSPPPPSQPPKDYGDEQIYQRQNTWSPEKEKIVMGPYDYLYGHPGKDIRSQLVSAFNKWLKVPAESLEVITKVVGMLHTSSLLVDDVEDSSHLRRGIPVAHNIFGTAQTINSANYVYFTALRELSKLKNTAKMVDIYTEELINLHRGQGMDLFWRDSLTCPSEADYLEMVGNKTGGLFRLAIKLMQAESSSNLDCVPLCNAIGLLFQILDDHLNLSPSYTAAKGLCEDLTEGKFSFPVIHAIRADPANRVLLNILKQKTTDEEVKRYAVDYMRRMGSFEYSRACILELRRKALELTEGLERQAAVEEGGSGDGEAAAGREGAEAIRAILERMKAP